MADRDSSSLYERLKIDESASERTRKATAHVAVAAVAALSTHAALTPYACTMTMDRREPNAYVKHVDSAPGTVDIPPNLLQKYADTSVATVVALARIALAPGVVAQARPPSLTKA